MGARGGFGARATRRPRQAKRQPSSAAGSVGADAEREVVRGQEPGRDQRLEAGPGREPAREPRHCGKLADPRRGAGGQPRPLAIRCPHAQRRARGRGGERRAAPAPRACAEWTGGIGSAKPDTTSQARDAVGPGWRPRARLPRRVPRAHVSVTASDRPRQTTACGVRAGRWNSVPGSRSKVRHPARRSAREPLVQLLGRARSHPRPDGHRPPALQLEPERIDLPVVMEPHACASRSLDDEQERALLARDPRDRAEEGAAQADHEPRQARQDLVHLREVRRLAGRERGRQAPRVARAVDLSLGDDLEGEPGARHLDRAREVGRDPAPRAIAWRQDDRTGARARAGETPARARPLGNQLASGDRIARPPPVTRLPAIGPAPTPSFGPQDRGDGGDGQPGAPSGHPRSSRGPRWTPGGDRGTEGRRRHAAGEPSPFVPRRCA